MTQKRMYKIVTAVFVVLSMILVASASYTLAYSNQISQTQMPTNPGMGSSVYSINVASKPDIGSYLTNATGWTLYTFARDIPTNGTSKCTGKCIQNWPAFYTANLNLPPELNANSFTVITRPDGGKQIAYDGYPLYYFRNDTKPGDTNGEGFLKVWFAATYQASTASLTSTTTASTSTTTTVTTKGGGWGY